MRTYQRIIGLPGLGNVGVVREGYLYRSQRPDDPTGYETAANILKIRSVINLQAYSPEENQVKAQGMIPLSLPMTVLNPIPASQMVDKVRGLKALQEPFLVHCAVGHDRTGYFCGTFRMVEDGWAYEEAEEEMRLYIQSSFGEIWWPIRRALKQVSAVK
jgi:protein tyrosine/serine phosphatase